MIQVFGKRIQIDTLIVVVAIIISTCVLIFYEGVPKRSAVIDKNNALEELRKAEEAKRDAMIDSIRISQRIAEERARKKDNEMTDALNKNTDALNRNRNEKNNAPDYRDYNTPELQRAVSNLVRQYTAAQ